MRISGFEFDYVDRIEPLRDSDGSVRQFMPQNRYKNTQETPLNRYGVGPFCKFRISNRFQTSGVYVITLDDDIRYVGECANLSERFKTGYGNISPKNCFKGGQETNCRLNNLIYTAAAAEKQITLLFFQTADYKTMEAALRSVLDLAWNLV